MLTKIRNFKAIALEKGQGMVEYGIIIAVVALLALVAAIRLYVSYPLWLSDEKQEELAKAWTYPAKRKRLRKVALEGGTWSAQRAAVEKLPYPEEREI